MKRVIIAAFALVFILVFAGCGRNEAVPTETEAPAGEGGLSFTAEGIDGSTVSFSDFKDKKVIMVNFFESWCPPCVEELPDLAALYDKYAGEGFVILGVFGSSGEDEIRALVDSVGVHYPVVSEVKELSKYRTDYVPTTVFLDGEGNLLSKSPYVGGKSYSAWESIILSYLEK